MVGPELSTDRGSENKVHVFAVCLVGFAVCLVVCAVCLVCCEVCLVGNLRCAWCVSAMCLVWCAM